MVGMVGGMTYENPEIQKAIDKTFIAQQEKVVNLARFEAQQHLMRFSSERAYARSNSEQ